MCNVIIKNVLVDIKKNILNISINNILKKTMLEIFFIKTLVSISYLRLILDVWINLEDFSLKISYFKNLLIVKKKIVKIDVGICIMYNFINVDI